ncbi:MAG: SDR family NAD(P)-dependent oxidoreductase [Halieaceae bacterium]|nr:SDR family NAD(P)-dependent oxidoreductase [Halieaceae bacterium]
MKNLKDKVVVITGAGSGIGRALAHAFAGQGSLLALSDNNRQTLAETVRQLELDKERVLSAVVDSSNREATERFAAKVVKAFGQVDVVINNAGIASKGYLDEVDYATFERVINVNMWGVVYGTRAFLPYLKERPEAVLANVSSIFGMVPAAGTGPYNMSKYAVLGFNETLMIELKDTSVKVLSIHPGGIGTNIANNAIGMDKQGAERFNKNLLTSAPQAAKAIVKAIKAGKSQLFIGPDALVLQALKRAWPGAALWASGRLFNSEG